MTSDITQQLKQTYGKAALEREAARNLNGDEWKQFQQIKRKYADLIKFENRAYELEYKTRVEVVRKRLINKAGEKNRDFKHRWFGSDRFDKSDITRQAERQVRDEHRVLLDHLEKKEMAEIDGLLDQAGHRQKQREKPKNDFARAADRRDGQERRHSIKRRRD
ncbi:MAG: hypothetical protein OXR62_16160 [Ahrensia sp.]|nr:hypothetical protein [Ahrensia sp.]